MSRNRRNTPQLESLEGKMLLAAAAHPALAAREAAAAAAAAAAHGPFTLNGSLQVPTLSVVTFTQNGQNMGSFKVSGAAGTMGRVTGTFVALLDSTNQYMSQGAMVVNGRHGTVTLSMTSDPKDPTSYDFTIASGTGAYTGATGSGKMATSGVSNGGRTLLFHLSMN